MHNRPSSNALYRDFVTKTGIGNAIDIIGIWILDVHHPICVFSLCHQIDDFLEG